MPTHVALEVLAKILERALQRLGGAWRECTKSMPRAKAVRVLREHLEICEPGTALFKLE